MFEIILHVGAEHPNLSWIIVPSILSFLAGLGIGMYSDRIRDLFGLHSKSVGE